MRILMVSAEGPPLKRAGALVDVMEALPAALRARGHEVGLVLPFYRQIREDRTIKKKNSGVTAEVTVGDRRYAARYLEGRSAGGVQLFFVRCDEFFDRKAFTASAANRTKIMPRDSFSLPRQLWNWPDG